MSKLKSFSLMSLAVLVGLFAQPLVAAELEIDAPPFCPTQPFGAWHYFSREKLTSSGVDIIITPETINMYAHLSGPAPYTVYISEQGYPYLKFIISPDDRIYGTNSNTPYIYIGYIDEAEAERILDNRSGPLPPCIVKIFKCSSLHAVEAAIRDFHHLPRKGDNNFYNCFSDLDYVHEQFVPKD